MPPRECTYWAAVSRETWRGAHGFGSRKAEPDCWPGELPTREIGDSYPAGDSFRRCTLPSSASPPGVPSCRTTGALPTVACCRGGTASPVAVPRCRIDAAPPDGDPLPRVPRCLGVARCRGRARCQTRWRFTKWVPHHRAALRCRPWRVAGRWRVVRRDAVVPNGCPTARRRSAADRGACRTVMRRQTRCRVAEWRCTCGRRSAAARGVSPGQ